MRKGVAEDIPKNITIIELIKTAKKYASSSPKKVEKSLLEGDSPPKGRCASPVDVAEMKEVF